MSVRSAQLAASNVGAPAGTDIGTVPAGHTWIIKGITVANNAVVAADTHVVVRRSGVDYSLWRGTVPGSGAISITLFAVLEPGDVLRWSSGSGSPTIWVSGADLIGVAL